MSHVQILARWPSCHRRPIHRCGREPAARPHPNSHVVPFTAFVVGSWTTVSSVEFASAAARLRNASSRNRRIFRRTVRDRHGPSAGITAAVPTVTRPMMTSEGATTLSRDFIPAMRKPAPYRNEHVQLSRQPPLGTSSAPRHVLCQRPRLTLTPGRPHRHDLFAHPAVPRPARPLCQAKRRTRRPAP